MKKTIAFILAMGLICVPICNAAPTSAAENQDVSASETVLAQLEKGNLVERTTEDGTGVYYVDADGNLITNETVLYEDTIYYFCESGYGLPYKVHKVNDHITGVVDAASDTMYVITGSEKALVIDTMVGTGNVKEMVELLTDLPYDVVLTHGHVDHIGGIFDFDNVYLSEADQSMIENEARPENEMGYFFGSTQYGDVVITEESGLVGENDFTAYSSDTKLAAANDGDVFDLGDGYTAELISVPGHTDGSMAILFLQDRILLTGDSVNNYTYLQLNENATIESYRESLLKLKERDDEWDNLLFSHNNAELFPKTTIDDCIELCDEIMETNGECGISMADMGYDEDIMLAAEVDWEKFCRPDGKTGNIVYRKSQIFNTQN